MGAEPVEIDADACGIVIRIEEVRRRPLVRSRKLERALSKWAVTVVSGRLPGLNTQIFEPSLRGRAPAFNAGSKAARTSEDFSPSVHSTKAT